MGPGSPSHFADRIYQKFAQAEVSDTRKRGGTGLGLSIVRAIVERHGGTIRYDSNPDGGTNFNVRLPEFPETPLHRTACDNGDRGVLILEDDRDVALLLNLMLKKAGFESDMAYDAAQALEWLALRHYDVLTLDLMLPDRDGISLIRELRMRESTADLPIIVVSARAEQGRLQLNGDAMWVADWLQKPIDQDALTHAVAHAAQRLQQRKPHILHVEDEPDIVGIVQVIFQDTAVITAANTLEQARELLEKEAFDLMILDLNVRMARQQPAALIAQPECAYSCRYLFGPRGWRTFAPPGKCDPREIAHYE